MQQMQQITRDKLAVWFLKNEPEKYKDMCESTHTVNMFEPNIFHMWKANS